jgi:hypothetical protein
MVDMPVLEIAEQNTGAFHGRLLVIPIDALFETEEDIVTANKPIRRWHTKV